MVTIEVIVGPRCVLFCPSQALDVREASTEAGAGVRCVLAASPEGDASSSSPAVVAVGKREWVLHQVGQQGAPSTSSSTEARGWEAVTGEQAPGDTMVWVGASGRGLVGALQLRDTLRDDATATVGRLRELGIRWGCGHSSMFMHMPESGAAVPKLESKLKHC